MIVEPDPAFVQGQWTEVERDCRVHDVMVVDVGERGEIGQDRCSDGERRGHSRFRITIALAGHADTNSTDVCTAGGTSAREIDSKPNFGK